MFGEECVDFGDGKNISVTVDGKTVHICLETRVRSRTARCVWCAELLFLLFNLSNRLPLSWSVGVLRGWMHRGRLAERDGGAGCAAALWRTEPSHLRAETGRIQNQNTFYKVWKYFKVNKQLVFVRCLTSGLTLWMKLGKTRLAFH